MKETRIPYSLPMARARRDGIKTQTRRTINNARSIACPYGTAGDILLPVEPWRAPKEFDQVPPIEIPTGTPIWFDATGPAPSEFGRYRHARFLPKHLSAERDQVVETRQERLQDISREDALAEGIVGTRCGFGLPDGSHFHANDPRISYWSLWEAINGAGSVEANPLVWVIKFKRDQAK